MQDELGEGGRGRYDDGPTIFPMTSSLSSPVPDPVSWHAQDAASALSALESSAEHGLSSESVQLRRERYGANELQQSEAPGPWRILLAQFSNVLVLVLIGAAVLSALSGHAAEALAILAIVLFSAILGFVQEFRAERALSALRAMAARTCHVVRDGVVQEIDARDVVPGDVVVLTVGDLVPADGRLLDTANASVEEAALTGESLPVSKDAHAVVPVEASLGDRSNMAFCGTALVNGRARMLVTATGSDTQLGHIATLIQTVQDPRTPLQRQLDRLARTLAKAALGIVLGIVALGAIRGQDLFEMVLFGIALAVAVVPEALPAVMTISLAIGVQRMAERHVLVRKLPVVETLGSTTVICSDKTGTLTKNEMTVQEVWSDGRAWIVDGGGYDPAAGTFREVGTSPVVETMRGAACCNDAALIEREGLWTVRGDPTEGALLTAAAKVGLRKEDLDFTWPRVAEEPFRSETKRMITAHRLPDGQALSYLKGAPEAVLPACDRIASGDQSIPLTPAIRSEIEVALHGMTTKALRVIAVARRDGEDVASDASWTLLGLIGMIDPPRDDVGEVIAECVEAGIRTVMITGDHPATAVAIARRIGIADDRSTVLTSIDVERMDDAALRDAVQHTTVFARVVPEHKLRIVQALQWHGETVAMTGDGVNDAPALKQADVGVAMGITGTDVSKEAADVTLTDDNFVSIVAAVREGRVIFANIKKYLAYLLSAHVGEIVLIVTAVVAGLPAPLTTLQILYINLATDGFPALALAVDPPEGNVMRRRPDRRGRLLPRPVLVQTLLASFWSAAVNLVVYFGSLQLGMDALQASSATFLSLILIQFFKSYSMRSDSEALGRAPRTNWWLHLAIAGEVILLYLMTRIAFLRDLFGLQPQEWMEWLVLVLLAATIVPVLELTKLAYRRGWLRPA